MSESCADCWGKTAVSVGHTVFEMKVFKKKTSGSVMKSAEKIEKQWH